MALKNLKGGVYGPVYDSHLYRQKTEPYFMHISKKNLIHCPTNIRKITLA